MTDSARRSWHYSDTEYRDPEFFEHVVRMLYDMKKDFKNAVRDDSRSAKDFEIAEAPTPGVYAYRLIDTGDSPMRKRIVLVPLLSLALMTACEKKEPAAPTQAPPAAAPAEAPLAVEPKTTDSGAAKVVQANEQGKKVYNSICVACHVAGVAGAPKPGDQAAWAPRIAQGMDTLYTHSIKGFQGKSGVMPPKGGNMSLSDTDVKAAVDYMVSQSK